MQNYHFEAGKHLFFVDGGDTRSMKRIYVRLTGLAAFFIVSYELLDMEQWISSLWWLIVYIAIAIGLLMLFAKSRQSRFRIEIDKQNQTISAYDQQQQKTLWEEDFEPINVYTAHIQVIIGSQAYRYPVLAYGLVHHELVEDGIPYPEKTLLGFAEKEDVERIRDILMASDSE